MPELPTRLRVVVAFAAPGVEAIVPVELPLGANVGDAVLASGLLTRPDVDAGVSFAVFGERASATTPLREGDRVELLRPLTADPKEARRRRAQDKPLRRPKSSRKPSL